MPDSGVEKTKRFSVVIPLYNKGVHIRSTLESVLAQSLNDFEIVVIDDGSTDDSLDQVIGAEDSRIRVICQNNQGVSAARNRGIQEANGEYIAFLDADDHWKPWHLSELNNLIINCPNCGIYSTAHVIQRNGTIYAPSQPREPGFSGRIDNFFAAFAKSLSIVNSSTACISRTVLLDIGGFPAGVTKGEDVYLWIRAAEMGGMAYSTRVSAQYNQDAQNRSNLSFSDEIPYYMKWLDDALLNGLFENHMHTSAKNFLEKGIFFTAAGCKIQDNRLMFNRLEGLVASRSIKMRLMFFSLSLAPRRLLYAAKAFRHAKKRRL